MIRTDWLDNFDEDQGDDDEEEKEQSSRTRTAFPVSRQRDKSTVFILPPSSNDSPHISARSSQLLSRSNDEPNSFGTDFSDLIDIGQIEEGPQRDFVDNPWTIAHRRAVAQKEKSPSNPIEFIEREEVTYDDRQRGTRRNPRNTTFLPSSSRGEISQNQPSDELENISSRFPQLPSNISEEDNEPEIEILHRSPDNNPYIKLRFHSERSHPKSSDEFNISDFGSDSVARSETCTLLTHDRTTNTSGSAPGSEFDMTNLRVEPLNHRHYVDRDEKSRDRTRKKPPNSTRSLHQSKSQRHAKPILRPIKHLEPCFKEVQTGHSIDPSSPLDQYINQIPTTRSTSRSIPQSNHRKQLEVHPALSALYMPSNTLNEFRSGKGKQVDDDEIIPVLKSRAMKSQPKRRSSYSNKKKLSKKNPVLRNQPIQADEPIYIKHITQRTISKNQPIIMKEKSKITKRKYHENLNHVFKDHGLDSLNLERYGLMRETLESEIRELDDWPSSEAVAEALI
ncbi:hypothetical protein DFH28DRAFT_1180363 [Melampsora americana]|nr:hypothetical protein DFH28DRAFT_1180363 [Melampsora americana]